MTLSSSLVSQLSALARQYGAEKLVLYGSRARGDCSERSDIDLAVFGMPRERHAAFSAAVEELPTLLHFDLAFIRTDTKQAFLTNIEKDGITLYEKD